MQSLEVYTDKSLRDMSIYKIGELMSQLRILNKKNTELYKLVVTIFDEKMMSLKNDKAIDNFVRYD